jgi:acetyl-CoA synthetase
MMGSAVSTAASEAADPTDEGYLWRPSAEIAKGSRLRAFLRRLDLASYADLVTFASREPERFWNQLIAFLDIRFSRPYDRVMDLSGGIARARWCVGGKTNLVSNCLDKHVDAGEGRREAIVWIGERGEERVWSYADLSRETCRIAGALQAIGCGVGDVVALYMPMAPETVATFLAVAKIGGIVLPLFSGFGADAIAARVNAGGAKVIVTADAARRRGKLTPMKAVVDEAAPKIPDLRRVVVLDANGLDWPATPGRDMSWKAFLADAPSSLATTQVDADAPFMVLYTSGTTGAPKGAVHSHCGFMAKMGLDYNIFSDVRAGDRYLWLSDLGWFVVPAQIVFCGLVGATMVLPEGVPDYPSEDRLLRIVSDYGVNVVGVSPTLARMLRRGHSSASRPFDFEALRVVISGGEPWDIPTWSWLMRVVCRDKAPILNQCGGSEIGSLLLSSILDPMRPGGFSGPAPGTGADIVDREGRAVADGEVGDLVMRQASIGTTRGLWRDEARYLEGYWGQIPGVWTQSDLASRDAEGFWYVHGRSDDTIKISGKRTGPAEIETALIATGDVQEAAAIGVPDEMKGSAVVCVVVGKHGRAEPGLNAKLIDEVVKRMGKSFRPREVIWVRELPKNRSNKILRRLIRSALTGAAPGDLSTLVNPETIEELRAAASASRERKADA